MITTAKLFITMILYILLTTNATSQNIPLLEVEGVSKLKGTMYQSDSLDLSSIDIRNNFDPDRGYPIDSAGYFLELFRSNTLLGMFANSQSALRRSSTFGAAAGLGQTGSENISVGVTSSVESSGDRNISIGAHAGNYTDGDDNIIIGNMEAPIFQMGVSARRSYNKNIIIGNTAGAGLTSGSENIIIGYKAGPTRQFSRQLFIGSSGLSSTPLIGGSFESMYVDINGALNVTEDINIVEDLNIGGKIKSTSEFIKIEDDLILNNVDGSSRSIRLVEENGSNEFGFKLNYNGLKDRLELSTIGFAGNEGIRNIWTKNGRLGIGNLAPLTTLHVSTGTDVKIESGGYLTIGSITDNIAIDNNEIFARTSTDQPNKLFLNVGGEAVVVGSRLQLAYSNNVLPTDSKGEIRYNKTSNDFEGYDGTTWYSLTSNKSSFASSLTSINEASKTKQTHNDLKKENKQLESRITKLENTIADLLKQLGQ